MPKNTNKKTKRPKNYVFTRDEVGKMAKCSPSYVDKIRNNKVALNTSLAKRVLAIDEIAFKTKKTLKQEIDKIVN
jgi:hypothetical protein